MIPSKSNLKKGSVTVLAGASHATQEHLKTHKQVCQSVFAVLVYNVERNDLEPVQAHHLCVWLL